jgi:hypothetical protein
MNEVPAPKDVEQARTAEKQECREVSSAMIDAGAETFFRLMVDFDYLACAPNEKHIRAMIRQIYSSMNAA